MKYNYLGNSGLKVSARSVLGSLSAIKIKATPHPR